MNAFSTGGPRSGAALRLVRLLVARRLGRARLLRLVRRPLLRPLGRVRARRCGRSDRRPDLRRRGRRRRRRVRGLVRAPHHRRRRADRPRASSTSRTASTCRCPGDGQRLLLHGYSRLYAGAEAVRRVKKLLIGPSRRAARALGVGAAYYLYIKDQSRDIRGSSTREFVPTDVPEKPASREAGHRVADLRATTQERTAGRDRHRARARRSGASGRSARGTWSSSRRRSPTGGSTSRTTAASSSRSARRPASARGGTSRAAARRASPAVDGPTGLPCFLNRPPCNADRQAGLDGEVVAFSAGSGRCAGARRSARRSPRRSCDGGRVYVGDWTGDVYALRRGRPGRLGGRSTRAARSRAAVASRGGRVYFGAYDRSRLRLNASDGQARLAAQARSRGSAPGRSSTDARRRLRPRLHRLDRREGVLLRRDDREPALVAVDRRLRLLLAGRLAAARLRRLVQRQVLLPSTRRPATSAGSSTRTAPISGSPTVVDGLGLLRDAETRTYALNALTGQPGLDVPGRQVHAGRRGREAHVYLVGYARRLRARSAA